MKKTVSVNIKGINFLIEEDAYELLQDYLDRLTTTLRNELGCKEIIEDVELRIAELCSTKLSDTKTVIELADINEILAALGEPSDYVDDDSAYTQESAQNTSGKDSEKRLFRDTDNAIIGGVCQGIADFLKIDVVIMRAVFVVLFLFAGFGFPLYIILWIIVPKAKSTIDRLRMKGRPITVENVREEVENAAGKLKESTKNLAAKIRDNDGYKKSVSNGARILSTIAGIILIIWGLGWLITLLVLGIGGFDFIPTIDDGGLLSLSEFAALVLPHAGDVTFAWTGGLMLGMSAITFLLLLGSILLFRIRNTWANLSLLGIFLTGVAGLIICVYIGAKTGRDCLYEGEIERFIGSVQTNELVILPELDIEKRKDSYVVKNKGKYGAMTIKGKSITDYGVYFTYKPSKDSLFHIYQNMTAHARTREIGERKAKNIEHSISLFGDTAIVKPSYSFPRKDKLRGQDVSIIIEIPKDGSVRMDNHIIRLGNHSSDGKEQDSEVVHYLDEDGYMRGNGKYKHYRN